MAVSPGVRPLLGLLWLLAALPVHGRGDAFQAEEMPAKDLDESVTPSDDILDINQELILLEEPKSSFLMEGDIVRETPFRMFPFANPRWPRKGGFVHVPYIISYKYDKSSVTRIQEAFQDFEKFTCIKFVPYSSQRDFIAIAPLSGCFSSIGRTGGMQVVSLAAACLRKGKAVVLHQLMHVLGFRHEHSRADRDKYISIAWDEVLTGFESNFLKYWTANMLVDYDYASVMHYGRSAFSMRGLPTIIPLSRPCPAIGQSWNLSNSDIARVNKLYGCPQAAAQPATEHAMEGTGAGFAPSESASILPTSKVGVPTTWSASRDASATHTTQSARESPQPFSTTMQEGFHAPGGHARGVEAPGTEAHAWRVMSLQTPSLAGVDGKHPMVTGGMLHGTQATEMATESTAQKASVLQNRTSSTNQPLHYQDGTPSGPNVTETTRPAVPEVAQSTSSLASPAPLTAGVVKRTAGRPSKSTWHQLLSATTSMRSKETESPTPLAVGSSGTKDHGSLSPAVSRSVSATSGQEQLLHPTGSQTGGQGGSSAGLHTSGVWAGARSSSSIALSPEGLGNPTVGLGQEEEPRGQVHVGTELPEGSILPATNQVLPPSETNPSPSWVSPSGNPGEENGTDHQTDSLEGASSAARRGPSELLKGTAESGTASAGRTAALTPGGSTASAPPSQPSSPPGGGTDSPAHAGSPLVPFGDQTPGRQDNSQPENVRPFAGGRLAESANATKEAAREGVEWATTPDPGLEGRGFASPELEVGSVALGSPAVPKGMALPGAAGSLQTPRLALRGEGPAPGHPAGEILPPTDLSEGTATVSPAGAAPPQASATDAAADLITISRKSREPSAETLAVGSAPLTKSQRWASVLGRAATKPARGGSSRLQPEGTAWSTSAIGTEAKVLKFLFQKETSPVVETGAQGSPHNPPSSSFL